MSGYTENSIINKGRLDDGVQLISKPFTREQLARKIAEVIGTSAEARPAGSQDEANIVELRPLRGA